MKRIIAYGFLFLLAGTMSAQDCVFYFPSEVGTKVGYNYYSKPGKLEGSSTLLLKDRKNEDGKQKLEITSTVFDAKQDTTLTFDYAVWCDGDNFFIDMRSLLGSMNLTELGEFRMTSTDMELPAGMTPGQQLKDASFTLEMTSPLPVTITSNITNRKVDARENVTTPAGTFDCVRISYDTFTKMAFIKTEGRTVEWYAADVGIVKAEYYDKKGKLSSLHELNFIRK
ncbi:MAG: hypothetical protein ACM3NP_08415 [Actinomycetota bacterium]|jgi:hypothetical protein